MADKVYEINKYSKLTFEAPFTIPAGADLNTLEFVDILAKGLAYEIGSAVLTYGDATNIPYWDGTGTAPTTPYYTDSSIIIADGSDDDEKSKVDLEIFDPTDTKVLFNPTENTKVTVTLPVTIVEIPKSERTVGENEQNYFTNRFSVIPDGTKINSNILKIPFATYVCDIYGGEDLVARIVGDNAILKATIPTMTTDIDDNLVYTVTMQIDPALDMITPTAIDNYEEIEKPLDTPGYVYIRYGEVNGPLATTGDYIVTSDNDSRTITFVITQNANMKNNYMYIYAQTKLADVAATTPIRNPLIFSVDYIDPVSGEDITICSNTLNEALVNLKPTIIVQDKIIL